MQITDGGASGKRSPTGAERELVRQFVASGRVLGVQRARKAQHIGCDRQTLRLIGLENAVIARANRGGKFPAEIPGVLKTGIQSLRARRRMDVGRISSQKSPPDTISFHHSALMLEARLPGNANEPLASGVLDTFFQPAVRHPFWCLQLEQLGVRKRRKRSDAAAMQWPRVPKSTTQTATLEVDT